MEKLTMKNVISRTLVLACLALFIPLSFALTLQEAKSEGLVGELRNGYVGLVVESVPAEVMAMVRDVNNQRRELYQQIAQENNISIEQVGALAFEKAIEATPSGQYLQNASGAWQQKL
ncbi:MAG: hypothetical protein DHS20C12_26200 [Pseudohongiella sp.]|nr:MAG: hypothetical protein DHS20C12_26200 [Pseudohongiella sp.]